MVRPVAECVDDPLQPRALWKLRNLEEAPLLDVEKVVIAKRSLKEGLKFADER
jgi:hypothetical protein